MLHILWILLKFILILLGILLGLILVAVLLILFCPVRYRASGTKETDSLLEISAQPRVSWLFGVVSFQLQYQNGTSAFDFRLFGIPIMKLIQKFRNRSHPAEKKPQNGHTDSLPANTEVQIQQISKMSQQQIPVVPQMRLPISLKKPQLLKEIQILNMHEQRLDISFIDSAYFFGIFGTDLADYGRKFAVFLPLQKILL